MIADGQIWENGIRAVKIQKNETDGLTAVTFEKKVDGELIFSDIHEYDTVGALDYLMSMDCVLTDKKLSISAF